MESELRTTVQEPLRPQADTEWAQRVCKRRRWDVEHLAELQHQQRAQRTARQLIIDGAATRTTQEFVNSDPDAAHWHTAAQRVTALSDVSEALRSYLPNPSAIHSPLHLRGDRQRLLLCTPGHHDDIDFNLITRDLRMIEDSILSLRCRQPQTPTPTLRLLCRTAARR